MDERTDSFLSKYRELEQRATLKYGFPDDGRAVLRLTSNKDFRDIAVSLKAAKDVRNLISHYPKVPVKPSSYLISALDEALRRIGRERQLKDIMTVRASLICAELTDSVLDSLIGLKERDVKTIPITKDGLLVGVFSGTCLAYYLAEHRSESLEGLTFAKMEDYILFSPKNPTRYRIMRTTDFSYEAERALKDRALNHPLSIILITDNGMEKERLRGVITGWDLL